ncbi:MAG: hypothetical protein K8L99_19525 [Anaerolineae bacterium]|nr:hypothetical protein [Anaerolineae bacterium]
MYGGYRHHYHRHHGRCGVAGFPFMGIFLFFLLFMIFSKGFFWLLLIGAGLYLLFGRNQHWDFSDKRKNWDSEKPKNDDEVYYV